jgi:hypothetical protein
MNRKKNPVSFMAKRQTVACTALSLGIFVYCIMVGCSGAKTIWSVEAKSPDGQWIASGRTDQYSGPGNAAVMTGVYLQRTQGDKRTEPVLSFSDDQSPANARIIPTIEWLTPTHLQVSFNRHPELDLQVVKYAGIEISVRDLSVVASGH